MNEYIPPIIIFVTLLFAYFVFMKVATYVSKTNYDKFLFEMGQVKLEKLAELASLYKMYVLKRYKVDIDALDYEEKIKYIATHHKILNLNYKKYFPKGKNWLVFAAAATVGEIIKTKYQAEWEKSETEISVPLLNVKTQDNKQIYCELFFAFATQMPYDEDLNVIQEECIERLKNKGKLQVNG